MNTDYKLTSKDKLSELAKRNGIKTWNELTKFIKNLPYGRNKNRTDFGLVLSEQKGTCSSKHALLKSIADLNNVPNIKLITGIYRMTASNTPKIGTVLAENSIEFIPEAHCYLEIGNQKCDFTSPSSDFDTFKEDIIEQKEIKKNQLIEYKLEYHKRFLKQWLLEFQLNFGLEELWR